MLVVFSLVNLYSLFVYIEHNGDESPKDSAVTIFLLLSAYQQFAAVSFTGVTKTPCEDVMRGGCFITVHTGRCL
jgi:hypothetical protein